MIEQKQTTEAQEQHDESASDQFLRQLSACGVDYFFANGGTDFPPIAEAFARAAEHGTNVPRPMVIPHENVAVSMAHGVYMTTGRPQAVMVHVNVGTANTVNAVLNASRDETPVLLFAGRSPYSETGRHGTRTRYIHWAQEMFDQGGMLREAVKWDYELHLPEQAADLVARAYQVAMTSPRGPVYATLPRDVLAEPIRVSRPDSGRRPAPAVPYPQPDDIRRLADWIATAERPLIITQGAGRTRAGFDALARVADRRPRRRPVHPVPRPGRQAPDSGRAAAGRRHRPGVAERLHRRGGRSRRADRQRIPAAAGALPADRERQLFRAERGRRPRLGPGGGAGGQARSPGPAGRRDARRRRLHVRQSHRLPLGRGGAWPAGPDHHLQQPALRRGAQRHHGDVQDRRRCVRRRPHAGRPQPGAGL
ncbi:hypothetical protein M2351_008852 [Azospirillum canadense]|nr:thiamine pyrophosphate-binding protein [Azospirillum canadense]MCW2244191.1 hypothetical protein [Azospirillum canadense]